VDDPHPILLNQRKNISRNMIAFCWEKAYLQHLSNSGFSGSSYLPLAADPSLFYEAARAIVPAAPLGFVGSSMGAAFLHSIKSKFLWNNTLQELADMISDRILSDPSAAVGKILAEVLGGTNGSLPFTDERNKTWLCSYIIHSASMKKRKVIIEALLPLAIETFGDPDGWKELCGDTLITHPDIDYRSQLCGVYQNIDINLNITSCQMKTAVNQRVFDVPMAGGFIISDNQQSLGELFELGSQAVCYTSGDELKTLIRYYKNNPAARKELTTRARHRILEEHTYGHRVKTILSRI
jgi:spore maturation protein CgeB